MQCTSLRRPRALFASSPLLPSTLPLMPRRREWLESLLRRAGLSGAELAERMRVHPATPGRWVRGEQGLYPRNRRQLSIILGVAPGEVDRLESAYANGDRLGDDEGAGPGPTCSDDAERRVRSDVARLVDLDGRFGGDDVLPLAVRLFRASRSDQVPTRGHLSAVAEAGEVAGWVAYDAGRLDLARSLSLDALHLAEMAGDLSMVRFLLSNLTMVDLALRRPVEALAVVEHVTDQATSPRIAALFELRRARGLAQMSEQQRAVQSFDRARVLLGEGTRDDDPWWSWWIDGAELAWHRGTFHAELGDWQPAADAYREAVESRAAIRAASGSTDRSRVVYNDLAHLADALATMGAWADLEPVLTELAPYVDTVGSTRTRLLLRRVLRRISGAARLPSTLGDLADQIGQTVGDRPGSTDLSDAEAEVRY